MNTLVVLFAFVAVACGSYVPLAQPPHHPAVVLDAHGRPLDTAEVINSRALHLQAKTLEGHHGYAATAAIVAPVAHTVAIAPVAHSVAVAPAVVAAPAAVSHQSRVDFRSSPAVISYSVAAPVVSHASPLLGHGHYLHKRSLGHYVHAAPVLTHTSPVIAVAPAAVSHQSRVDVRTSPAVVSHAVVAPYAHAAVVPVVHSPIARINHAAVAPIGHVAPIYSAPLHHAW